MSVDRERLSERLAAVERRLTDADPDEDDGGLADVAAIEGRLSELESRADDLDARLGDVESGLQALRGYVGGVDAVDEAVERRANAALAKAERLEARLDEGGDPTIGEPTADRGGSDEGTDDEGTEGDRHGRVAERGDRRGEPWDHHESEGRGDDGLHAPGIGDGSLDGRDGAGSSDAGTEGNGDRKLVDRLRDAL